VAKRKSTKVKTQITVNEAGLIVHKARHVKGSTHDYALFKQSHPHLPDNVCLELDLGYDGVQGDYPKLKCEVPFKRRSPERGKRGVKAKELTPEKKSFNLKLSKERVVVEHTFSKVKKFRAMAEEFRNRLKHYDGMTEIVFGIVNFRTAGTLAV